MKVLHLIPDSVADPRQLYLGSTKDVRSRTEYFKVRGIPFDEIVVNRRSDLWLLEKLQNVDLHQYLSVIFELPLYPVSQHFLRQYFPHLKILCRPINAEFYHQLHNILASIRNSNGLQLLRVTKANLRTLKNSLTRLRLDYVCAKRSDYILSITRWEEENYWNYLTGASEVKTVPYFFPVSYNQFVPPETKKKYQCVCLMSSISNPFLFDAAMRFARIVDKLGQQCSEWEFFITGGLLANTSTLPKRITSTGFLENPFSILAESRSIALLSDYGFGFKTKLLDAISHKCYVLVTKKLFQRLPPEVQPYCIVVNKYSVNSFKDALEKCKQPYPVGDPNDVLRSQAFAALDEVFCIGS